MSILRILATNDLLGTISPLPTSFGRTPGWESVRATARGMRDVPALWVDAGDFAQGGPLAPLSAGRLGFAAVAELGIDVAAAGNHEFDWGADRLEAEAARLPFPLLCANAPVDLPPTHLVETAVGPVGVIGLTNADLASLAPGAPTAVADPSRVMALAAELRAAGARVVVAALHDGVDWVRGAGPPLPRPARFRDRVTAWAPSVDAIVAGHTLARWMGRVGTTPVLQPWPDGTEIGVLELALPRSGRPRVLRMDGIRPPPGPRWTGPGAPEADAAAAEVVGWLDRSLAYAPGRDRSLPEAIAQALRDAAGAELGLLQAGSCCIGQAPVDGVLAWLPAGAVTHEMLLRTIPWTDPVMVGELAAEEIGLVVRSMRPVMWQELARSSRGPLRRTGAVRVATGRYASGLFDGWIGRPVDWRPVGLDTRAAFREWLRRGRPG